MYSEGLFVSFSLSLSLSSKLLLFCLLACYLLLTY